MKKQNVVIGERKGATDASDSFLPADLRVTDADFEGAIGQLLGKKKRRLGRRSSVDLPRDDARTKSSPARETIVEFV